MQKAIAIIQARMSSTRLPGKVMLPLAGQPVIWHVADRARKSKLVEKVIVATSTDKSDDELAYCLEKSNIEYYRGDLDNVLERFMNVIYAYTNKYIVRITADCPLIDPVMIDNQIKALNAFDADIVWCEDAGCALEGAGVIHRRILEYIWQNNPSDEDKEHVGAPFMSTHPELLRIVELCPKKELILHECRLTLDELKDYELFKYIYDKLWYKEHFVRLEDAIQLLKNNPELSRINLEIHHKALNMKVAENFAKWKNIKKVGQAFWEDEILDNSDKF